MLLPLPSVLWHCRLGDRKGVWRVRNWVLVCWRWFHWSFARLIALSVVSAVSVIIGSSKIQNGDVLVPAYPGCPVKWAFIHSFILSFIHSVIHSLIHSFIHMLFPREVGFERLGRCMFLGNPVRHTPAPPPKWGPSYLCLLGMTNSHQVVHVDQIQS